MRAIEAVLFGCLLALASGHHDVPCEEGRSVIVHLFEWKWTDVAEECERFLGPAGFCAVQVSPPNEHGVYAESGYPWWQRYQSVSYILQSRSGDEEEFRSMVERCNAAGVNIIVDAVINHMTGAGISGVGSAGSEFDSDSFSYPGVPYTEEDFTPSDSCPSDTGNVVDYGNPEEVRNCQLYGLRDLFVSKLSVRKSITDYLNNVIDMGVMGFRIDAAKYMYPEDIAQIQAATHDLSVDAGFEEGTRPFFFSEVVRNEGDAITSQEYYELGRVTEFQYGVNIKEGIEDFSQLFGVYKPLDGMALPQKALVFVDNHDNQRNHGGQEDVLTYKDGRDYTMAVVYTLAQDYGLTRLMSSYEFDDDDVGPPGADGNTDDVVINEDGSCGGGWVCEHRWSSIAKMVSFSNAAGHALMSNMYQDDTTVAFSRGSNAFFAMNKDGALEMDLQTGLAAGDYCDIISNCEKTVTVNDDGTATIVIDDYDNPFVAIIA